uniref:RWD domaincontaining protein 2Blike [Saccoglossus kowalevskii] n=1 Tax=Lepeophtheirus salmonis TaxID=72036 RepID=A0A0K2TQ75_LEPSM
MDTELQISELEMLESMYPDKIKYDEPEMVGILKSGSFVDGFQISFRLSIWFEDVGKGISLSTNYPTHYPSDKKIEVHLRSDDFDRESQSRINLDIMQYIKESCEVGDLLMGVVISWIQENGVQYFNKTDKLAIPDKTLKPSLQKPFSRLWIYSHHIYSKIKRKNILNLSKDYKVNGFSMPGKPGIICLEGQFVEDMWNIIKSWNWKKIRVKIQEVSKPIEDEKTFCKFNDFTEINFLKSDQTRDYHMDFGEFQQFLTNYGFEYIFKELIGLK